MAGKGTAGLSVIKRAKEILKIEAEGIVGLADKVGRSFSEAIELLYQCNGKIILTGIGKPGIIARKISATLASAGVPSIFLHPVEAVHGDSGMVAAEDIVIAISNSGETEELIKLIRLIRKIGSKLIVLTGNPHSSLGSYSDVCIDISVKREACKFGLVPTASTTAALSMGDALAVVLFEKRGFNLKDYAFYHPGGAIGRKLLQVSEVMRKGASCAVIKGDTLVKDVLLAITKSHAGSAVIVDKKRRLAGIFTDGDLRRSLEKEPMLLTMYVKRFMTVNPITIGSDMLAVDALRIIKKHRIDELIVVGKDKTVLGMVDEKDLLGLA